MSDSVLIYCSCLSLLPPEALLSINPLKRFGFRILPFHIALGETSAERPEVSCVEFSRNGIGDEENSLTQILASARQGSRMIEGTLNTRGTGNLPGPVFLDVNRTTNRFLVFKGIRVPEGVVEGARVVVYCAKFNL